MNEFRVPQCVKLDLQAFFEHPEELNLSRIGVVTSMTLDSEGGLLRIRGGLGDDGLHDTLAQQVGPGDSKIMVLPPEMASERAIVAGWYCPGEGGNFGLIAGQIDDYIRAESSLTYQQTSKCLRMAALALGTVLMLSPIDVVKLNDPSNLILGEPLLRRTGKKIGRFIYDS